MYYVMELQLVLLLSQQAVVLAHIPICGQLVQQLPLFQVALQGHTQVPLLMQMGVQVRNQLL